MSGSGERAIDSVRFFEQKGRRGMGSQTASHKEQKHHRTDKTTAHVNLKPPLDGKLRGPGRLPVLSQTPVISWSLPPIPAFNKVTEGLHRTPVPQVGPSQPLTPSSRERRRRGHSP